MSTIYGNALILPSMGGTSGGAGFSVTFPATATNWVGVDSTSVLLLADGTTKSIADYSSISGQTIENVIGIRCFSNMDYFVLKMTLSAGAIAQYQMNVGNYSYVITTPPNATVAAMAAGRQLIWWPIADTVISAIEMYDTD